MEFRVTSARYFLEEMEVYKHYQEAFEKFGAKISSDIETGNISICDLYFSRRVRGHLPEIWIKDGYME